NRSPNTPKIESNSLMQRRQRKTYQNKTGLVVLGLVKVSLTILKTEEVILKISQMLILYILSL
ncbi:hypothetical protein J4G08_05120, partial [Candidatus Poribacteria bacterium]|nr:hypothetical protein [Candidatus Poribacteria bacterium]